MATLTDEQRKENLKLAIETRRGVATAIADLSTVNSRILVAARKSAGENWRAAVGAMAKWRSNMLSGDIASARRALVDIARLKLSAAPVDNDMLVRVQEYLTNNTATSGADVASGVKQRAAWQQFIRVFPDARSNETTYGTYQAMVERYGDFQDSYVADDSTLRLNWDGIRNKVKAQGDAIEITQGYATAIEREMEGLSPDATDDDARNVLRSIESRYAPGKISPSMAAIERMAAAAPSEIQLTPEERLEIEANQKTMEQLRAQLSAPLGEMPTAQDANRDKLARLVASERFQWWAERNGFDVGVVHPATEGREYPDGIVTPVGVYVPGPDDQNAARFLTVQMKASKSENAVAHPILHRRLNNEKRAYGVVQIDQPVSASPVEDSERFRIGNTYRWFEDKQTGNRYDIGQSLIFIKNDDGTVSAWTPDEYWEGATPEERAAFEDASRKGTLSWETDGVYWYKDAGAQQVGVPPAEIQAAFAVSREPPMVTTPNPPLEVYGEFLAPTSDDPVGSVRMRTKDGDRVFTQDEIAVAPVVTTGGGPPQTLARFVELARGRAAHNKAEKNAYEAESKGAPVTPHPADRAAEALVPARYSEQERRRNEIRNADQERTAEGDRRRREEAIRTEVEARVQTLDGERVQQKYEEIVQALPPERQTFGEQAYAREQAQKFVDDNPLSPAQIQDVVRDVQGKYAPNRDAYGKAGPEVPAAVQQAARTRRNVEYYTQQIASVLGKTDTLPVRGGVPAGVKAEPSAPAPAPVPPAPVPPAPVPPAPVLPAPAPAGSLGLRAGAPASAPAAAPVPPAPPAVASYKAGVTAPPVTRPPAQDAVVPVATPRTTGTKPAGQEPLNNRGEAVPVTAPVAPVNPPAPVPVPQGRMPPLPTPESEARALQEKEAAEAIDAGQADARRERAANLPAYEAPDTGAPETRYSVGTAPRKPPMFSVQGLLRRRR